MWTHFFDMNSGGSQKERFEHCYIEAPKDVAKAIFTELFGHDPENVTCPCCGGDYSISEEDTLAQASGYQRNCKYDALSDSYLEDGEDGGEYIPLDEYVKRKDVYVLYADGCRVVK